MAQTQAIQPLSVGIEEAARSLGIARSMMYEMVGKGEIQSFKIGRRRLILASELKSFIERVAQDGAR
ncbi:MULTISPECIES: helix-turn-helix domain-containing protein [Pseudomonas]|jgi:excisionase family DNA binding protein|nr:MULTISPECIES: helix-turn-helix domain-containing protein [Pseudomonas]ANC80067.1 DNA-binding protein [Pseudomonas putida B6-2]AYO02142.1 helix-turn-helix domain-containing protein [Pseudomonas sp. LTGT-11-2Z]KGK23629.1 DNA-binding protein [Pseudomonas plecoglossicida]MDM3891440.1 helix-turn-helix domain-containing protein [Pseudomonas juntendi]WJD61283.1 helix-turn-helix domain-containing protein [Pseudomonas kurunegalensis]